MNYIFKLFFLIYVSADIVIMEEAGYEVILILLLILAINVFKEKYFNSKYAVYAYSLLICLGAFYYESFAVLLCISVYDFVFSKSILSSVIAVLGLVLLLQNSILLHIYILIAFICGFTAWVLRDLKNERDAFRRTLDEERRLKYDFLQIKSRLMNSARESAKLAEAAERNRISREIHDNAGHKIAGVLIQLQAAVKMMDRDLSKSREMLQKTVEGLSQSLEMLRETVHQLKPLQKTGISYIKSVIDNYDFCTVKFVHYGDFGRISPVFSEIIATNIKEALTNVSRHSNATKISVNIDVRENFVRLQIKDNGKGCKKIKEGMGLGGMRERMQNAGGSFSASGEDGFVIVCVLPLKEGGRLFENTFSR